MNKIASRSVYYLVKLGLTENEALIYKSLNEYGSLPAKEIAKKTNMLPNAVYRLTIKLENKNLISVIEGRPKIFKALPPKIALNTLSNRKTLEINKLKENAIGDFTKSQSPKSETEIEYVESKHETFMKGVELAKQAKNEILIISIGEQAPEEIVLAIRDAIQRGVKVKMIAHKYDEENEDLLKSWLKMGWEIRYYPDWGFHLVIVDSKLCTITINNPENTEERVGLKFQSEGLSKALHNYFYSVWERASLIR